MLGSLILDLRGMRTIMFQLPCFYYYYTPCLVTPGPVSPRSCEGAARGKSWKDCHSLLLGSFWAYACNMARIPLDIARSTITTTDISHHGLLCADRKASHQDPLGASFPFLLHPFQSCEVKALRSGGHAGSLGLGWFGRQSRAAALVVWDLLSHSHAIWVQSRKTKNSRQQQTPMP